MDVITIESKAFMQLMDKLDALLEYVYSRERPVVKDEDEAWVDSREVCLFLKISERTLQRLRTNGRSLILQSAESTTIKSAEIRKLFQKRVIKSTDECLKDLIAHHR